MPNKDGLPLNIMVLILTASVGTIGANSLATGPIAPSIATEMSADISTTLYAAGSYGIGTALGALLLSPFIDKIGPRKSLIWALTGLTICFLASAASPDIFSLILAQGAAGLAAGMALPAIYAFAAQIAPKGRESTILGRVLIGWTLSLVAGVSLSSLIADMFHWRLVYLVLALFGLAAGLAVLKAPPQSRPAHQGKIEFPFHAMPLKGVRPWLAICFLFMIAFYGVYGYLGDHISSQLGLPLRASGLIAISYGIGFALASFADPILDRFGPSASAPFVMTVIAGIYLLLGLTSDAYLMIVAMAAVWGMVNHLGLNLLVAALSGLYPEKRGIVLGLNSAVTYLAASAGAFIFGPLYEQNGFLWISQLASISVALAAIIAIGIAKSNRRRYQDRQLTEL